MSPTQTPFDTIEAAFAWKSGEPVPAEVIALHEAHVADEPILYRYDGSPPRRVRVTAFQRDLTPDQWGEMHARATLCVLPP